MVDTLLINDGYFANGFAWVVVYRRTGVLRLVCGTHATSHYAWMGEGRANLFVLLCVIGS